MGILDPKGLKRTIDLAGPEGNAYFIIGQARLLGKELGWSKAQLEQLQKDMMSSDYEHLIQVFDEHFGDFIDLVRPSREIQDEDTDD